MSDLGIIASGLTTTQTLLADTAANLANVDTDGYAALNAQTANVAAQTVRPADTVLQGTTLRPDLLSGDGAQNGPTQLTWSNARQATGVPTNLAVEGAGFFIVNLPTGGPAFTRNGDFVLNAQGLLALPDGATLTGLRAAVPGSAVSIASNGIVTATSPAGVTETLGTVSLALFANPGGLAAQSGTVYTATPASGPAQIGRSTTGGRGSITAGALNLSEANPNTLMGPLLSAETAYTADADALHTAETVSQMTDHLQL